MVFCCPSSNAPAQPTQNRYSVAGDSSPSNTGTSKSSFLVQSSRLRAFWPHGLPLFSRFLNSAPSSDGNSDSIITWWRRMSTMWSTCSMSTGHCSTHAPHVVHDHSTSGSITPPCSAVPTSGRAACSGPDPGTRPKPDSGTWCPCPPAWSAAARERRPRPRRACPCPPIRYGRLGQQVIPQVHDHELGRQRLAGVPGRALALAATALGAGGEVEHALPGEVLDLARGRSVASSRRVLEVDRLALVLAAAAAGPAPWGSAWPRR